MRVFFDVIGCRLNQSEVEALANTFRALGHEVVAEPGLADLAIVNTCAVTSKAAADSRKKLRRAGRDGAHQVIATGCWATLYPEATRDLPNVSDVVVNEDKDVLVAKVLGIPPEELATLEIVREPLPGDRGRTRAFIKVQEGCDNACTYCVTRLARGRSRSRSWVAIKRDIQAALAGDAKEIVLTGVQLGAWGRDLPQPLALADLLESTLATPGVGRLRLSSIEPWDIDLKMLILWKDDRLCRHLHVPLQSASDPVLKAMGRPFTKTAYRDLIAVIREAIPDLALTTDVIAGFPGETEEDFLETCEFIRTIGFADGHVFTYSPRPGTAAYKLKTPLPTVIARARNAGLRTIFQETGRAYRMRFIGRQMPVLWESSEQIRDGLWRLSGLTDNYLRVFAELDQDLWNQITSVKLVAHHPARKALWGEMIEKEKSTLQVPEDDLT